MDRQPAPAPDDREFQGEKRYLCDNRGNARHHENYPGHQQRNLRDPGLPAWRRWEHRSLFQGRFHFSYVVLAFLRGAGFTIPPAENRKESCVVDGKNA